MTAQALLLALTIPVFYRHHSRLLPMLKTFRQLEADSTLSNWVALTPDPHLHFFSARLNGDAHFYRSLTAAQKSNYDELQRLFRQQYKPNADVLKAQVKSLCLLPGQDISAFKRTLRDLAGKV